MIQFISYNTEPSQDTLAKIAFINALNNKGIPATLYGHNSWPKDKCNFQTISEFKIRTRSKVWLDNINVSSNFELVNLEYLFYSFGRKKALLRWIKKTLRYFLYFPFLLISRHQFKKLDEKELEVIHSLLNNPDSIIQNNNLIIFQDIKKSNYIDKKIQNSKEKEIWFFSSIKEPLYFNEKIIPLLKSKNIFLYGFCSEKYLEIKTERNTKSKDFDEKIQKLIMNFI